MLGVPLLLVTALAAALLYALDGPEGRPAVAAAAGRPEGTAVSLPGDPARDGAVDLQVPRLLDGLARSEVPTEDRIATALAELTPMLDAPVLLRTRWDLTSRALARYVGPQAASELLALVTAPDTSPPDRVAAGELLRHVEPSALLNSTALVGLRQAAFGGIPDGAQASAARRVLAGLGDWSDRLRLVHELDTAPTPETALAASWSLRASRSHDVLPDLRRLIHSGDADSSTAELAVLSAESILRSTGPVEDELRDALTDTIVVAVGRRPGLGGRAAGLLAALGGPKARRALTMLVRTEAAGPAAQALAESPAGRQALATLLVHPAVGENGRLAAATALARGPDDGDDHADALEALRVLAREGAEPDLRRSAVLALAEYAPEAAASIEAAFLEDPDASVRATASVAARRLDDPATVRAALAACVVGDESAGVRELAGRVLSETEPIRGE